MKNKSTWDSQWSGMENYYLKIKKKNSFNMQKSYQLDSVLHQFLGFNYY